jgi:AraC-like DNA-binding protein
MKPRSTDNENTTHPIPAIKNKGISVHCTDHTDDVIKTYSRKDFYKVCLYIGKCVIEYADRAITLDGFTLFFGTPHIPYSWVDIAKEKAYSSLFTEAFLKTNNHSESLQQSPLFKVGGTPIFHLSREKSKPIIDIFEKMIEAYDADYAYKDDLIRNYLNLLIHEALRMQPSSNFTKQHNAAERIASLFLELLERQFPVESPERSLTLKSARDFAKNLSIHVNHLNHAVKDITGKSTSAHISERIITEAKALLKHTSWSVAEIGYSLGFEYPTYFNNFFKKSTGTTPTHFRS